MRSLRSLLKEEQRLRERHTEQFKTEKWSKMNTTQRKLIDVLNAIARRREQEDK